MDPTAEKIEVTTQDDGVPEEKSGWVSGLSRRVFLRTGAVGAAAAGVAATVPGLSGLLSGASADAPAVSGVAADTETLAPSVSGPIVAHITDAASGDLNIYVGNRTVPFNDPALVQHILRAAG